MTHRQNPSSKTWSLPITWILVFITLSLVLGYRYGWWWLGVPVALYCAIVIISVSLRRKAERDEKGRFRFLRYPLYGLFHMESVEQSSAGGYVYDIVPGFREDYDQQLQCEIMKAMELAVSDPDLDFSRALPGLPFNNADIRKHLAETLKRLKSQA